MNQAKLIKSLCLALGVLILACQSGGDQLNLSERNLLEYGVPLMLEMPDSAEVKMMDWGIQKDITVKSDGWYSLQIFTSRATTHDRTELKNNLLETVQESEFFSEVSLDEPDGFIFELQIDTVRSYDFRHVKIQGDNEYIFQAGMMGSFTREQVEDLYQIAKRAK